MTFKQHWEKAHEQHEISADQIKSMIALGCPGKAIISTEIIAGGCANINIKVQCENSPLSLLRIYLRDQHAPYREQKIALLIKDLVPIPSVNFIGNNDNYTFAITEFISGITLRELLLSDKSYNMGSIMEEVGMLLSKLSLFQFPSAGFFDKDLNISETITQKDCLKFSKDCLSNNKIVNQLSAHKLSQIDCFIDKYAHLFPDEERHLVHGDFDPANILVHKVKDEWKVSGILDWEFSFSGSVLQDIANMLRYSHKMPKSFEAYFLSGLAQGGIHLPSEWRTTIHLLNLLSLLDLLARTNPHSSPNQSTDIKKLIDHILEGL